MRRCLPTRSESSGARSAAVCGAVAAKWMVSTASWGVQARKAMFTLCMSELFRHLGMDKIRCSAFFATSHVRSVVHMSKERTVSHTVAAQQEGTFASSGKRTLDGTPVRFVWLGGAKH